MQSITSFFGAPAAKRQKKAEGATPSSPETLKGTKPETEETNVAESPTRSKASPVGSKRKRESDSTNDATSTPTRGAGANDSGSGSSSDTKGKSPAGSNSSSSTNNNTDTSPGGGGLSEDQKERMRKNREAALARKKQREAAAADPYSHLEELVPASWRTVLEKEFRKSYWTNLKSYLKSQQNRTVFPPPTDTFNALRLCPFDKVKVVILGQDPYHNHNQAHGLCFSVRHGIRPPPSLVNIYKELEADIPDFYAPSHGCLEDWARQGVLLLNTCLSVQAHKAGSHRGQGWEQFTSAILNAINRKKSDVVFLLWGKPAQAAADNITKAKHHILTAPHPSPLSAHRGFFGKKHFSTCNRLLQKAGKGGIDWRIRNLDGSYPNPSSVGGKTAASLMSSGSVGANMLTASKPAAAATPRTAPIFSKGSGDMRRTASEPTKAQQPPQQSQYGRPQRNTKLYDASFDW